MTDLKNELDEIKVQALAAFRRTVDREELKGKMADSACEVLVDRSRMIYYATPEFERVFGYEPEQLEGHHISKVIPARFHTSHEQLSEAYMENPGRRKMSERPGLKGLKRNGDEIDVRIELRDVYFHGVAYFVAQVFEGGAGTGG